MRILIVEDNARLADLLGRGITERGFRADVAADLEEASGALRDIAYDAIILDLHLPDGEGLEWLARERSRLTLMPVLILTARDSLGDRVKGLDGGADDYLVKPVDMDELAARLRAQLRRPGPRSSPVIRVGQLMFDVAARSARNGDVDIELTRREAELLELLMRRAGTVVRRSVIEDTLYDINEVVTFNAIEATVSRLRHKLEESGGHTSLVTIRGVGYMLKDVVL
jgi:two-component system response regulator QseB